MSKEIKHVIHSFCYCPACASENFILTQPYAKTCDDCGYIYHAPAVSAVAGFIQNAKGQLLFGIRARNPGKGKLGFIGGFVDPGESLEDAIKREAKEEAGANVTSATLFCECVNDYAYKGFKIFINDTYFICNVDNTENLKANDDVESFKWLYPYEIKLNKFAFSSAREAIIKWIKAAPANDLQIIKAKRVIANGNQVARIHNSIGKRSAEY